MAIAGPAKHSPREKKKCQTPLQRKRKPLVGGQAKKQNRERQEVNAKRQQTERIKRPLRGALHCNDGTAAAARKRPENPVTCCCRLAKRRGASNACCFTAAADEDDVLARWLAGQGDSFSEWATARGALGGSSVGLRSMPFCCAPARIGTGGLRAYYEQFVFPAQQRRELCSNRVGRGR